MRLIDADKIDFGKVFIGASDFAKDTRFGEQCFTDKMFDECEVICNIFDNPELFRCGTA